MKDRMARYISELLQKDDRAVIPELGAFIRREGNLLFNELITFNDGLLTELISEHENLNHEQSTEALTGFVDVLKKQLEEKGSAGIEGIGTLIRNESGKIDLSKNETKYSGETPREDSQEMAGKSGDQVPANEGLKSPEGDPDDKTGGAGERAAEEKSDNISESAPDEDPEKSAEDFSLDESGMIEKNVVQEEYGPMDQEGDGKSGEDAFIVESVTEKESGTGRDPAGGSTRRQISPVAMSGIILVAAIVLATGTILLIRSGIFSGERLPDRTTEMETTGIQINGDEKQPENEAAGPADMQDAGQASEMEEIPVDERTSGPAGTSYYVVAGVFIHLDNAERYVETLKSRGYDAEIFDRRRNMYGVSLKSFGNKQEALSYMEQIRSEFEPRAWVLHYRAGS